MSNKPSAREATGESTGQSSENRPFNRARSFHATASKILIITSLLLLQHGFHPISQVGGVGAEADGGVSPVTDCDWGVGALLGVQRYKRCILHMLLHLRRLQPNIGRKVERQVVQTILTRDLQLRTRMNNTE